MGIFDLFKKLVKENKVEEIVTEKLVFSDIENWLENKIKENEFKQNEIILIIKDKIKRHNNELNKKIKILEDFDVDAKKEKENIKGIVNNSKKDYIRTVENFLENLNNLEMNGFEEFMKKINKIFLYFSKSSYKNYERATILIGKEMASVKESVKAFSKELLKTFDENKPIIDSFKNLLIIKEQLDTITPIDKTLGGISEKKSDLNKKIRKEEEENRILKHRLEEIKTSFSYLENLAKQKKIKSLRGESKKDILELKQLLDFKALANFFHINPEQMRMVKDHREDFYTFFLKDDGKSIISLLDEAKLSDDKILEKIKKVHSKLEEIANQEKNKKEDKTQEIYSKIKEIALEIDNLKIEKAKEEKRHDKLKIIKEESVSVLRQELAKLNVEFV